MNFCKSQEQKETFFARLKGCSKDIYVLSDILVFSNSRSSFLLLCHFSVGVAISFHGEMKTPNYWKRHIILPKPVL